jgi:hypothetical protein
MLGDYMANFNKQQCKECIGNTICDDTTLVGGMACKKFALKLAEALKPSHNKQSTPCQWWCACGKHVNGDYCECGTYKWD